MRYSTMSSVVMAAMVSEAVAGPAFAHLHQRAHHKRSVNWESLDWHNMGIDWTKAYEEGKATPTTPPAADATPAVPAAAYAVNTTPPPVETPSYEADPVTPSPVSTSPASGYKTGGSVSSGSSSDLWRGLVGAANDITEFGSIVAAYGATGDFHMGNYGRPYGHNLMKVASTSGYDFTTTFVNTASEPMTINCWNKVGPDILPLSGSALAPKNTTLTMYLKPGASQVVAVQENSQIACSEATDNFAASGAFAESWFEANFVPTGSGYDLSAIMSSGGNNYDMSIACEEVECISDPTQNFWVAEFKPVGGSDGSCYVPPGPMHLTAKFGGKTTKYGGSI